VAQIKYFLNFNTKLRYLVLLGATLFVSVASAQEKDLPPPTLVDLFDVLKRVLYAGLALVGVVVIIMILIGAIKMALSLGDPKALQGAHLTWTYAAIGAVVVLGFFLVFRVVTGIMGIETGIATPGVMFDTLFDSIDAFMCKAVYNDCGH